MSTKSVHAMFAVAFALVLMMGITLRGHAAEQLLSADGRETDNFTVRQIENNPLSPILEDSPGYGAPVLTDVRMAEQGRQTLLVKTWDVPPGFDPEQLVEDGFERGGLYYRRAYVLLVSENFDDRQRLASETVTVSYERRGDALAMLLPIIEYSRDGYTGQLTLNTDTIITEPTGQRSYSYAVTDVREFTGLARNDPYLIPRTVERNGVRLQLVDLTWRQEREGRYTAIASYRGTATGTVSSGYISTATYIGEVSKSVISSVTYAVVYEGSLIPPPPFDFSPFLLAIGGAAILLIAAAILLSRRDNTRVYAMIGKEYQLVHKQNLTNLSPIVDLSLREISGQSDEFMITLDRLAFRRLRGHSIKIIGKDGMMKEQRIYKVRHFRIGHGIEEEYGE